MDINHITIIIGQYYISLYYSSSYEKLITERKYKGTPLIGLYSYKKHPPHIPNGQSHLHLYMKNNKLFAINKDGTAHDKSHGITIPKKVGEKLRIIFPDYKIPKNNIIEGYGMKLSGILIETYISKREDLNS
ncbi:MAG: hypothetical protein K9N34_10820 [Candidatus Marinimicrobia bacterium]|nr:hypothetical protein [Candidatus Neomarinimicrobiota bacterium]